MGFFENLAIKYGVLTRQTRKIADFVRENPESTLKMTAKELGTESGASAAAVIRLCRQLGYESLGLMKISLARDISREELTPRFDTMISDGDSSSDIVRKLYGNTSATLQKTVELIDYDNVKQAVSLLKNACRVYLFGVGSSGHAATELCHRLNRVGKTCVFLQDSHTNLEYASVADKKDVVICFSYSGETKEVYLAAERAKRNDVPVISVTRNRTSSLSLLSSIVFNIPEREKRVRVGAFGSITSQMFIADVLYIGMISEDFKNYEKMLVETFMVVNRLRE